MLALMIVSMVLSMWITNSAVTAMLLPIVRALVDELFAVISNATICLIA